MAELEVRTSKKLLEKLEALAKRGLTAKEIHEQRVSFIYAGMPKNSGMSKIDIERELNKA